MKKIFWIYLVLAICTIAMPAGATPPVGTISTVTGNLFGTVGSNPEGISIDFRGHIYTGSSPMKPTSAICEYEQNGTLIKSVIVPAGPGGLINILGIHYEFPHTVFAVDFANTIQNRTAHQGRVLSINMESGVITTIADGFSFPNAFAQDLHGHLYVSDSFQNTITRMSKDGSNKVVWSSDPLLAGNPAAPLPIGVNGMAFDLCFRHLYVANTSNRRIVRIDVNSDWSAGAAEVFADGPTLDQNQQTTKSLLGADGIAFDLVGNLYVMANAANEIQVVSPAGVISARYSNPSLPLDVPASPVFWGNQLFFTNLSLYDGGINSSVAVLQTLYPGLPPL
jgi:sugar lactone lactonase YvrE